MTGSSQRPPDEETLRLRAPGVEHGSLTAFWEGGGVTVPLPMGPSCVIGRSGSAGLVIDHASLSRSHAVLHLQPDLAIEDLGSSNGTTVRGKLLRPNERAPIAWGEPVELGRVILVVRPPGGAPAVDAAAPEPDATMAEALRLVQVVAPTDISVLILGETGSGKGWVAAQIHQRSKRAAGPWLHLNCAAFPENLLESELFGYERGAFTGAAQAKQGLLEAASGGTVFLDEVGELPLATQAKLLLALERREVHRLGALKPRPFDVRFVSATNRQLEAASAHGTFRIDLYYRLAGLTISVPPLRHRREEIAHLATSLLEASAARLRRPVPALSPGAVAALQRYDWPGNVRELGAVLERALLFCEGTVEREHLGLRQPSIPPSTPSRSSSIPPPPQSQRTLAEDVHEIERRRITEALEQCAGNQSRAAELLGISRRTLINRMVEFGFPRPRKG